MIKEKENFAMILKSIGDGVITIDKNNNITFINKITEELTGFTLEEAMNQPLEKIFNIIDVKTNLPQINPVIEVLKTKQIVYLKKDTILISKDKTQYFIEDSAAPILDDDKNLLGVVLVFRDITEKQNTITELHKIHKLESLGILAGGIAHDFNNILAAILGNIELAKINSKDQKIIKYLEKSKDAIMRAKDLSFQLLTFSKGGEPIKRTKNIYQIIEETSNFILHGSPMKSIIKMQDKLWYTNIDSGQISQVIQNIIINAKEAMNNEGIIEIKCSNISDIKKETNIKANNIIFTDNKYVKIEIIDKGHGISDKNIDKVFDPYFTLKQMGNGLGLSICYSIIKNHNGYIFVNSKKNIGTNFVFYLPAIQKEIVEKENNLNYKSKTNNSNEKKTIIVMDDQQDILDIVKELLEHLNCNVILVKNGYEAIRIYKSFLKDKKYIDYVFMDLTIPGSLGGKITSKELLKIDPLAKLIIMSGYSNDYSMSEYKKMGFIGCINKPFSLDKLIEIIN